MRVPGIPYVQGRNDYTDWDGRKYGIAIHNTSNDASDEGEASYATRRTDGVSSHLYVDDDSVTQSLDTDDRAGHAGSAAGNDHSIAVEITGGNGKSRAWWLANVAWDKLGKVLAYVITHDPDYEGFQVRRASVTEMKANPKVKAFYGHDDMRRAWGGTTHTDPGPNFPWDRLIQAVNDHLQEDDVPIDNSDANRVWRADNSVDTPGLAADGKPRPAAEIKKNPKWSGNNALRATYNNVARVRADLRAGFAKAAAERAALRALVQALAGTVSLTPEQVDQLAAAVAEAGDTAAREVLDRLEAAGDALADDES